MTDVAINTSNNNTFKNIESIRIIDFRNVSYLDSQAIYHAVAHSFNENTPETITIMSPIETYACVGFFQDIEKEVDIGFCNKNNIPVLRREVGGGAVLLDNNQLFFHFIFNKNKMTRDVNRIYSTFLAPAVNTYNKLGLKVYHRPINDLQINGKKIGGTGAVEIGNSIVVVGSFMFDFNYDLMSKILKVPSEKFRDKIYKNIKEYITTIKKESSFFGIEEPDRKKVKDTFLKEINKYFKADLIFNTELTENEKTKLSEIRKLFCENDWLYKKGKFLDRKVKITSDVNIYEGNYKTTGGLLRFTATRHGNKMIGVDISGDFTIFPPEALTEIENIFKNVEIDYDLILKKIEQTYRAFKIQSPGIVPADYIEALKHILQQLK